MTKRNRLQRLEDIIFDLCNRTPSDIVDKRIELLEYERRWACRTCGEPGREIFDNHGIYAGVYCDENCCPLTLNYRQEDIDDRIEPFD